MNGQETLQRDNRYMPMSVKDWLITYLIMFIPMVNFIMLIVWSVSDKTNVNRQNWARAAWIYSRNNNDTCNYSKFVCPS